MDVDYICMCCYIRPLTGLCETTRPYQLYATFSRTRRDNLTISVILYDHMMNSRCLILVPNRQQTIMWTSDGPFHLLINASLVFSADPFLNDVMKWKQFPRYWPFVRGIHQSPVVSPPKGQWLGSLMFSLICAWTTGGPNNRDGGDLRCHRAN